MGLLTRHGTDIAREILWVGQLAMVKTLQEKLTRLANKQCRYCKVRNIGVLKFSELINFSILANRNISV